MAEVGKLAASAKNAFNSFVGRGENIKWGSGDLVYCCTDEYRNNLGGQLARGDLAHQ